MNEKNQLKMSLEKIRNMIDVNKTTWQNIYTTNCYAYALGLDIPEKNICKYAYDPGTIGNSQNPLITPFSYNVLVDNVLLDLEALRINYDFIKPTDEIDEDEWKISLYIPQIYSLHDLDDFHFIRYRNNGYWYHKNGIKGYISNLDYYDQPIRNPITCDLNGYTYMDCLKLKLKK